MQTWRKAMTIACIQDDHRHACSMGTIIIFLSSAHVQQLTGKEYICRVIVENSIAHYNRCCWWCDVSIWSKKGRQTNRPRPDDINNIVDFLDGIESPNVLMHFFVLNDVELEVVISFFVYVVVILSLWEFLMRLFQKYILCTKSDSYGFISR